MKNDRRKEALKKSFVIVGLVFTFAGYLLLLTEFLWIFSAVLWVVFDIHFYIDVRFFSDNPFPTIIKSQRVWSYGGRIVFSSLVYGLLSIMGIIFCFLGKKSSLIQAATFGIFYNIINLGMMFVLVIFGLISVVFTSLPRL